MDKDRMTEALEDELYLKKTGHTTAIEVFPGGTLGGLDYGPVVVDVVVLDHDGSTLAYRISTDAQDEDWQIGHIEDAVQEAVDYYEQTQEAENERQQSTGTSTEYL